MDDSHNNLQELFARLKSQPAQSPGQQSNNQQPSLWAPPQPSVSSPIVSPPVHTPNPIHSSNILSPVNPSSAVGTPGAESAGQNHLLGLLKFNGQSGQQQGRSSPMANLQNVSGNRHSTIHMPTLQSRDSGHSRPLSDADLMSNLRRTGSGASPSPLAAGGAEKSDGQTPNPQAFLLNLLTKPKSQQTPVQPVAEPGPQQAEKRDADVNELVSNFANASVGSPAPPKISRGSTPVRQFGSPAGGNTPFEAPQPTKAPMFNYVNPFDQLSSSSPLNRTPNPETQAAVAQAGQPKKIEILKHNRDASNNGESAAPASKSRKTEAADNVPTPEAENKAQQSVSEALEDVGEQVDKQVEKALAAADKKSEPKKTNNAPTGDAADDVFIKKEPAGSEVESSWESAEDDTAKEDFKVEVYNFPMKPFVSLQIKQTKTARPIRQDHFMVIAQLKKEFDQIDRCLVTASQTHIVYAQVATKKDNGGFRIIRQDSGDHKQVFRSSGERIFSVQLCNSTHDVEAVLGTGVNGSVFWTSLAKSRGDLFADDDVEGQGFIMPPVQTPDENTSGSPVKTRAKLSNRHPEWFAMARGKQIFIVAPEMAKEKAYCSSATRKINSEKFFEDHSLKINTGKAGKDFCFSEDDSVIASLDKNGRCKFWGIAPLTARTGDMAEGKHESVELREPIWTINAATSGSKPDEKPSVSSIMFLDKDRPTSKGAALRYMIVGFRQNHILQLWDLGLGKAVQEIRLPHEKDSDGICSISYHPKTGIIAIGHPTRNSIYFVHLSAPKYNIPQMDQARYIGMLASGDPALPKPESTAIMSGLREFSFAKVGGQLRSIDMLKTPVDNGSERNTPDETLFELYVMHSKGVIGISIKREDLGWDAQSKMVNPKDALKEGIIEVSELVQPQKLPASSEQSSNADTAAASKPAPKPAPAKKADPPKPATPAKPEIKKEKTESPAPAANGLPRMASPEPPSKPLPQIPTNPPLMTPDSYANAAQRAKSPIKDKAADDSDSAKKVVVSPKAAHAKPNIASITGSDDMSSALSKQFDSLYQRIESDKRVSDAAAGAKQDALLRLVSSTLTENVDRSLSSIIANRIEKDVIPTLTEVTSKVVDRKIAETLPQQLNTTVATAMKATLSNALQQALKDKEVHRTISDVTSTNVAAKVHEQVSNILKQSLPNAATQAAQKMVSDLEKRFSQQQRQAEQQRQQDNTKIEELSNMVRNLSNTIQNMATSQAAFQEQIIKMQREQAQNAANAANASPGSSTRPDPQAEAEDKEVADMTQKLMDGAYEEATIQWISSDRQADIFDKLFVRVNPSYLEHVSPLVALTVSAAITSSFETNAEQRLEWLSHVLNQIDVRDDDIRDVAPKIMDVLSQRLQGAYMQISETKPSDPALRTISSLHRQVDEIRRLAK
ncbi:hypothetical protein PRZ48_003376 [Zasmidium cellare]|uniref:EDC4-like protein pdc1 beta-propeller domain-containing protein n=1 Tax=Zasmidium cellare TaxID=395010 RepID=A0ABR0EW64_ZASCE|nr:hypothetical protein PRZ48_003376 [Zasmidium cellare]